MSGLPLPPESAWRPLVERALAEDLGRAGDVTSAAVMYRMGSTDCGAHHRVDRAYTYSGIGVVVAERAMMS